MKNIFVGNLSRSTSEDSVRALFEAHGVVNSVSIVRDRETGEPRGFAFVEMASAEEADRAIAALNGGVVDGRPLNVNEARPRAERGGGRGGFGARSGGPPRRRREPRW